MNENYNKINDLQEDKSENSFKIKYNQLKETNKIITDELSSLKLK